MSRSELIRDLQWAAAEMDRLAEQHGDQTPPPFGPAMVTADTQQRLIATGQTVGLSRRYIDAILSELKGG